MQKIIVITGFPGSGKTTYFKEHADEFGDALICDDYYKSAPGRTVEFRGSVYYNDLRGALKSSRNIVIADIVFCEDELRQEMQESIKKLLHELGIEAGIDYRFFANDPESCIENIRNRNRQDRVKQELAFIATHRDDYHIPIGANVIPVFRRK